MSLTQQALLHYVLNQLANFFPDKSTDNEPAIRKALPTALDRVEFCFSKINIKYYTEGSDVLFNHLNGDQYAVFLYYLGNTVYRLGGEPTVSTRLFLLNKLLTGLDAYYEVELPDIFILVHPLATVLGRANYANYLMVYQRCSIGSNHGVYPTIGPYTTLHPGASVFGHCTIEGNCSLAAQAMLIDTDLKHNSVYFGSPGNAKVIYRDNAPAFWR